MITSDIQEFSRLLKAKSPILALDFGTKKIGVAVSTPERTMSIPISVIGTEIKDILPTIERYKPCAIVIGMPINMNGSAAESSNLVYNFAKTIYDAFSLPIFLQDERLTSKAATSLLKSAGMSRKDRDKIDDKIAASMILDTVLETIKTLTKQSALPEGFCYLKDMDSTILQDIRYAGKNNFIGEPVDGYETPEAVMTYQAAEKLVALQRELRDEGMSLLIYEAYRPKRALTHFANWAANHEEEMKDLYYPRIDKSKVFELGYISSRSRHCSGSTIDLTIIEQESQSQIVAEPRVLSDGFLFTNLNDGSVDMGCHFDFFDIASWHDSDLITADQLAWRNFLRRRMEQYGFRSYRKEWWHYELIDDPFEGQYFDFKLI